MEEAIFSSGFEYKGNHVTYRLGVYLFVEGPAWIAYCPELDLSACGTDRDDAKKSFEQSLDMTLKYMINKKTLVVDLEAHGWKVKRGKKMNAPTFEDMLGNDVFRDILSNKEYQTYRHEINIPCMA